MIKLVITNVDDFFDEYNDKSFKDLELLSTDLQKDNIKFVCTSSYDYQYLKRYIDDIYNNIYYVCNNGSYIVYKDTILYDSFMDKHDIKKILYNLNNFKKLDVLFSTTNNMYTAKLSTYIKNKIIGNDIEFIKSIDEAESNINKVTIGYDDIKEIKNFEYIKNKFNILLDEDIIKITSKETNIPLAINKISNIYNIKRNQIISLDEYLDFNLDKRII